MQRIDKVRRTAGMDINDFSFDGQRKLTIPPNTKATILFDQTFLTTAYPEISVTGGKDSQIVLTYSEALFDSKMQKGNRDEIEGRKIYGYTDTFLPDGGDNRLFSTLWFRTWRYLQMDIRTKDAPLTINDFYGRFTAYPFKENASFSSSDPSIKISGTLAGARRAVRQPTSQIFFMDGSLLVKDAFSLNGYAVNLP